MNEPFYQVQLNLNQISLDLADRSDRVNAEHHENLVKRLAKFYATMIRDQKKTKLIWQPAGEWKNYNEEKNFLYEALLSNNLPLAHDYLLNFWRNRLGLIVKEYATFEVLSSGEMTVIEPFLRSILRNYIIWKDLYALPSNRLKIKAEVGNPWGCNIDGVMVTPKATRYHHNAMQIKNLLAASKGNVVGEIGAGYGALCHYLLMEIPNVIYVDFDLPETLVLAAYHLLSAFPDKKILLYGEHEINEKTVLDFDVALLPNFVIEEIADKSIDVFFNSFSLSEMPKEVNHTYLHQIARLTKNYFLHNNMDRSGIINRGFERIPASKFPIDENKFTLLYQNYDLFHSHFGDYKEFLYFINS